MNVSDVTKAFSVGSMDMNRELALNILWNYLRDSVCFRKLFKRRAVVNGFSVDFFSTEWRLVVQVAGDDEFDSVKILMSSFTEMMLSKLGYSVVVISSEDVLLRCEMVLRRITEAMNCSQEVNSYCTAGTSRA